MDDDRQSGSQPKPLAELRLRLDPSTGHLSMGRHVISTIAASCSRGNHDVELLVASELMANAVEHAARFIELRVEFHDRYTRIDVLDDGDGWPRLHHVDPLSEAGGRGLSIVDQLSTSWGVEDLIPGKQVWSIIACKPPAASGGESSAWLVAV